MKLLATLKDETGKIYLRCELLEPAILLAAWIGNDPNGTATRRACETVLELVQQHHLTKVLDDNRQGHGAWPNILKWLDMEWIPAMAKAGALQYAHVLSPDQAAKIPAHLIFDQQVDETSFVTFDSYDSALRWLKVS